MAKSIRSDDSPNSANKWRARFSSKEKLPDKKSLQDIKNRSFILTEMLQKFLLLVVWVFEYLMGKILYIFKQVLPPPPHYTARYL